LVKAKPHEGPHGSQPQLVKMSGIKCGYHLPKSQLHGWLLLISFFPIAQTQQSFFFHGRSREQRERRPASRDLAGAMARAGCRGELGRPRAASCARPRPAGASAGHAGQGAGLPSSRCSVADLPARALVVAFADPQEHRARGREQWGRGRVVQGERASPGLARRRCSRPGAGSGPASRGEESRPRPGSRPRTEQRRH
jgi:hypothetical protein